MEYILFFLAGVVYGKYIDPLLDALIQYLISCLNVKISSNNDKVVNNANNTHAIGFVYDSENELYEEDEGG